MNGFTTSEDPSYFVDIEVPCRMCSNCLAARRNLWAFRAKQEHAEAVRTWFGTLTLRPEEHFKCVAHYIAGGGDTAQLDASEQFAMRHKYISRWITLYLKRVRKESGAECRYLFVAEAHKSGLPHYHCLLHELSPAHAIPKSLLQRQWWHGYSAFKLVSEERQLWYVAKYLAKDSRARVRASVLYGRRPIDITSGAVGGSGGNSQPPEV